MKLKKVSILMALFLSTIALNAQGLFKSVVKAEIGLNRNDVEAYMLRGEEISGGIGWNGSFLYNLQARRFFLETGVGVRTLNYLISENLSQTQKFTAKANHLSIPVFVGTYFLESSNKITPILKAGLRGDYHFKLNSEDTELLKKEDLLKAYITFEINAGVKLNRFEVLFAYNSLNVVGVNLAYRILN